MFFDPCNSSVEVNYATTKNMRLRDVKELTEVTQHISGGIWDANADLSTPEDHSLPFSMRVSQSVSQVPALTPCFVSLDILLILLGSSDSLC